jgi:hypothetical protein
MQGQTTWVLGCEAMKPTFSVRPDRIPVASWDDPADPRHFLGHFLGSEVHLALYKADAFLQAIDALERGERASWSWSGNSFSVDLGQGRCVITNDWWEPGDPSVGSVELTLEEFRSLIAAWRDFVVREAGGRSAG